MTMRRVGRWIWKLILVTLIVGGLWQLTIGIRRAVETYQWTKVSLQQGREAYAVLSAPVPVGGDKVLMVKDASGKEVRIPLAEFLRVMAIERGVQMTTPPRAPMIPVGMGLR